MSGKHLDVPQRSPDGRYLARGIGDEGAPAGMTRTADEAEVPVPAGNLIRLATEAGRWKYAS